MRRLTVIGLLVLASVAGGPSVGAATGSTDYWQVRNKYTGEVDFFGFIRWHGNRFCYQEWTVLGPRKVIRQEGFTAKPIPGTRKHEARGFLFKGTDSPFKVKLRRVHDGWVLEEWVGGSRPYYRTRMKDSSKRRFIEFNLGELPSSFGCPKF